MRHLPWILFSVFFLNACQGSMPKTEKEKSPPWVATIIPGIEFVEQRIFLSLIEDQDTLSFFTDTGGGRLIYPNAVAVLNLKIDSSGSGDQLMESVDLTESFKKRELPVPTGPQFILRQDRGEMYNMDGLLGASWFAKQSWLFDYKQQQLAVLDSIQWDQIPDSGITPVYFLRDSLGTALTNFPRIDIIVERDTISTLFDSGATAFIKEAYQDRFEGFKAVATSFMSAKYFDQWREEHPEWTYLKEADTRIGEDMLQVPEITIAGHTIGPVWFARRADKNFIEYMSQWMDETVYGAIGGSAFAHFDQVLIDYSEGKAYFKKEND